MILQVSLDDKSKFETFFIKPWVENTTSKKGLVLTDNPRKILLDKKVDSIVQPFIYKSNMVGMVLGVLKNNALHVYGYGETKSGNKTIPDGNTLFEIGSISKTFTATLLADFVLNKKISLSDPINKYLPDSIPVLQYNGIPITVQTLSNHSSGLPRLPGDLFVNADPGNPYKHYDNKKLLGYLKQFIPIREPGKEYEYSNLAVGLLGVILERVSGKSYEELLQQNICKPIGMKNTRVALTRMDSTKFAVGHDVKGQMTPSWEFISLVAAGGIRSSVNDMLLYAKAQVNEGNSRVTKAMDLTRQQTFEYGTNKVGLGWHFASANDKKYVVHNGQTGGYHSIVIFNPDTDIAIVILTNGSVDTGKIPFTLIGWLEQN